MKQLYLLFFALVLGTNTNLNAQCTIDPQYTSPGLYPSPDSLPCFLGNGFDNDITVQFVNFDSATVSGIKVRVDYIIIDEILNLPCNITWTTSAVNKPTPHRFDNQEHGCIRFFGVTADMAGQYKLSIKVKAKVSLLPGEIPYDAESLGFRVDVRLKDDSNAVCPDIDTTANAVLLNACNTGIATINSIALFRLYPNPVKLLATVSFTADKAAAYTTRIVNIYGQEVSREVLNVTAGLNVNKIDVSTLATGVYIFTITDGKNVQTQRFVVEK